MTDLTAIPKPGAVDRPETRDEVLALLEGGAGAYKKRGERYGFQFSGDGARL